MKGFSPKATRRHARTDFFFLLLLSLLSLFHLIFSLLFPFFLDFLLLPLLFLPLFVCVCVCVLLLVSDALGFFFLSFRFPRFLRRPHRREDARDSWGGILSRYF